MPFPSILTKPAARRESDIVVDAVGQMTDKFPVFASLLDDKPQGIKAQSEREEALMKFRMSDPWS